MRLDVISLHKNSRLYGLSKKWRNMMCWFDDWVLCQNGKIAGEYLIDEENGVAVVGVFQFKTSIDEHSKNVGIDKLIKLGHEVTYHDDSGNSFKIKNIDTKDSNFNDSVVRIGV
jgi:hypothetical protein